jgi:2-polyprenyl-6-methoxyphenol hydroxylase-like FAD-dependent oxidoreductase
VLIVGAGVAGLALARALRPRDITAEVVERMPEWGGERRRPVSAGQQRPGARRAGIWAELAARANPIVRQRFLDHRGRRLADIDVRSYWDGVAACVAIRRASLHEAFRAGSAEVPLRLGL